MKEQTARNFELRQQLGKLYQDKDEYWQETFELQNEFASKMLAEDLEYAEEQLLLEMQEETVFLNKIKELMQVMERNKKDLQVQKKILEGLHLLQSSNCDCLASLFQ